MSNTNLKKINSTLKFVYSDNNSLSVMFYDNDLLMGVVGEFNENLKELEKITNSSLYSRGNSIIIKSTPEKNEITKNAIKFFFYLTDVSIDNVCLSYIAKSNKIAYALKKGIYERHQLYKESDFSIPEVKALNIVYNSCLSSCSKCFHFWYFEIIVF